ncbi:hypothetical protein [Treponema pedis]|uniref:hypothetical protein n=1 Tax=Treponema pedis TaxID=409322 RepID=UPI00197E213C|nr:hypothetical protein [Treponema pedis]QSI05801.1 hypothetical protein DYQ05_13250 [Treponema pedis]
MAKNYSRRKKSRRIRFLILCFIFLNFILYSETKTLPQPEFQNDVLFLNSFFTAQIKLDADSFSDNEFLKFPQLVIEDAALELVESEASKLYDGILIKNKYKLKKTGDFTLEPKLILGKKIKKLNKFSIYVEPPELSVNTKFKWKIFSDKNKPVLETVKGGRYKIVLFGFFYIPNTKINSIPFWEVNCQPPENSILETCGNENLTYFLFSEQGWKPVGCFYWTPLESGEQRLPSPVLSIPSKNNTVEKTFIPAEKIFVRNAGIVQTDEFLNDEIAKKTLEKTFDGNLDVSENSRQNKNIDFKTLTEKAKLIAELRQQEAKFIFPMKIKNRRLEIEKELNIIQSFSVTSIVLKKAGLILLFLFIFVICIVFALNKKKNQKSFNFVFTVCIVCVFFLIAVCLYFFINGKYKKAVYVPSSEKKSRFIYQIPEVSGTAAGELKIGETVIIKKQNAFWLYVEKSDKTSGWKDITEFIIID